MWRRLNYRHRQVATQNFQFESNGLVPRPGNDFEVTGMNQTLKQVRVRRVTVDVRVEHTLRAIIVENSEPSFPITGITD